MKTQTVYFNMRTAQGVETIDEFTRGQDSPAEPREFRAYIKVMLREYHLSGQPVYVSSRSTKDWKNKQ